MKNRLILINSFDYGSTGTLCTYLKEHTDESFGKPIFLVSNARKTGTADYYLYENASKISRFLLTKKNEMFNDYGFCSKKLTKKALNFALKNIDLNNEKITISIHQIESSLFDLRTIFEFAKKYNCKVTLTLHDCWPFTGKCAYYDMTECKCWMNGGCKHCNYAKEFPTTSCKNLTKSFERKIKLFKDNAGRLTFICPSKWIYDELDKSQLKNISKVVINNGIKLPEAKEQSNTSDERIGLIAVAYPWTERKGLKYLNYLAQNLDNTKFRLTVVGLDKEAFIQNAICYNKVDRDTLFELYSSNDYFLNPTMEDNFPTVNIEALACGLKIVSFKTGGSCEIFDEETGYSVERGNKEVFLEAVNSLSKNNSKNKCTERALNLFSKDKYVEMYYNLFKLC